jgi:hypothetical protein
MRQKRVLQKVTLIILVLSLSACSWLIKKPQPDELATPMKRLTPAVQAVILWPENTDPQSEDKVIEEVFKEKPELREAFQGLVIKIRHNDKDVVILVCSQDGKNAWLEDASWTIELDKEWYKEPSHPCEFSLDPLMAQWKKLQ